MIVDWIVAQITVLRSKLLPLIGVNTSLKNPDGVDDLLLYFYRRVIPWRNFLTILTTSKTNRK